VLVLGAGLLVSLTDVSPAGAFPGQLLPESGIYFGSAVKRSGMSQREALEHVESQIGRRFAIDHQYYAWGDHVPTGHQRWDIDTGRLPLINWRSGPAWASIASGAEDDWIRERADAFVEFGAPIYLAFHHEPENDLSRYGSPSDYASAFRRIVTIFRDRGVTNVGFVWNMMAWSFDPSSGRDPESFYPGDDYVDFVGANGYNWYPERQGDEYRPFSDIYEHVNAWSVSHGKPWIICEYGSVEDPQAPGRKASWLLDALATAKAWSALRAMVYFDLFKDPYHWETDTSPSALDAYRQIAQDPYTNGSSEPLPVPSPTPPPSQPPSPGQAPPTMKNGLNAGPQGAPIQANGGRSGRRSKVRGFDAVSTTRGATLTFDAFHARGPFSAKHVLNAGSDAYYEWRGSRTVWFGRLYVWFDAFPAEDLRLVRARSAGALRCSINIRYSGQVGLQDENNAWVVQSSRSIALGRWVRIEWKVDQRKGRVQIRIYARAGAQTPTEVLRAGPRLDIGSSADQFQFGRSGSNGFAGTFWTDSPALSSEGFLGPGRPGGN
jgi:hypothetical protein